MLVFKMETGCLLPWVGQQPQILCMFQMTVKLPGVKVLCRSYFEHGILGFVF
jgi:hypothetical protein